MRQSFDVHLIHSDCNSLSLLLETLPEAVLIRNAMGTLLSSLDGLGIFVHACVKKWRRQTITASECVWRRAKEKMNDRKWEYVRWFLTLCPSSPFYLCVCVYLLACICVAGVKGSTLVMLCWRRATRGTEVADEYNPQKKPHMHTQQHTQVTERWKEKWWEWGCLKLNVVSQENINEHVLSVKY